MKNFIRVLEGVHVCIEKTDYEGYLVPKGHILVDRFLAEELFKELVPLKSGIVIASKSNGYFSVFKKIIKGWTKVFIEIPYDYSKDIACIGEILATIPIILKDTGLFSVPKNHYIGDSFVITNKSTGSKCNDGRIYITYTRTSIRGLYEVSKSTSRDFSTCGTGFSHFEWLEPSKVGTLCSESVDKAVFYDSLCSKKTASVRFLREYLKDVLS